MALSLYESLFLVFAVSNCILFFTSPFFIVIIIIICCLSSFRTRLHTKRAPNY